MNFGYFYDRSPIIAYDGAAAPDYTMATFTSSTVPGCRAPHVWMADGTSLYDHIGPGYALLRTDRSADPGPLLATAAARNIPLTLVDLPDTADVAIYAHALTIVRPDQHVAWRGNTARDIADAVMDRLSAA